MQRKVQNRRERGGAGRKAATRKAETRKTGAGPVRYAVVGLGYIAQVALLPAFAHARKNSALTALVSDDPKKLRELSRKYGVQETYDYDQFDACLASENVDAVLIALPNHLHHAFTLRAANAGKHVLCEKPLAVDEDECRAMIAAAEDNGVRLMTAYRLHFDKPNLEAIRIARSGRLGELRVFNAVFCNQVDEGNIRLQAAAGGGTLYDIGIYCINAARNLFAGEPEEVQAFTGNNGEGRFAEVDEMTSVLMRFPGDRLATFTCSFGGADCESFDLIGTKGSLRLEGAYSFSDPITQRLAIGGRETTRTYGRRDQFAPELLYFSDCVRNARTPEPSGREGLADVRVIQALLKSAKTGRPVRLESFEKPRRADPKQEIHRPPVREPELVDAAPPHAG